MYANFTEYKEKFLLGREAIIPEASFNFYSTRASDRLNWKKVELERPYPDYLIKCTCAVAELFWSEENEVEVTSQSIGGFSQGLANQNKSTDEKIKMEINGYLANTDLHNDFVFRGM